VGSTNEMLQAMLDDTAYRALQLLADTTTAMSGRTVATALGVAPTTATVALRKLRQAGFATSTREGRADRWRLNSVNTVIRSWLQETREVAQPLERRQGRAVILTALPEEYEAVVSHLDGPQPERAGRTRYEYGKFHGAHIAWTVHVAEIGMGNVAASTELAAARAAFEPDVVLFVGVAGSVKPDDLCRGDVVVGSEAFNIHAGKDSVDDGGRAVNLGRPVGPQAQYGLVQLATTVRRQGWTGEVQLIEPGEVQNAHGTTPKVVIKAIAAGEVVHGNIDSALMKLIRTRFSNVAAVDMESFGLYEAAHRLDVPALAVRGISDSVGDKTAEKDREWQPVAAKHAAGFAFALLRAADAQDLGIRPRPSPTPPGSPAETAGSVDDALFRLPPAVAVAYEAAARAAGDRATALIRELADQDDQWDQWLQRFRRTQPESFIAWDAGPLWVVVAAYADSHHHASASWLYEQAAERTIDTATRAFLYARAALAVARDGNRDRASELLDQAETLQPHGQLLWNLHRVGILDDGPALLATAAQLISPLDLAFLRPALSSDVPAAADSGGTLSEFLDDFAAASPELFEQLRFFVAYWAGMALRITNQLQAAQLLFEILSRGMPSSRPRSPGNAVRGSLVGPRTATVITQLAATLCARVTAPGGTEPGFDNDRALSTVFELALTARDRLLDWHGPTTEQLRIAALARSRAGDPRGALVLLLPPPNGIARPDEAAAQPIIALAAELAAATEQTDLAFGLAERIEDRVERHIATGLAYMNRSDCHAEAAAEFRHALHNPDAALRPDQQVRAVLALSLIEEPTDAEISLVEGFDRQTADLIRAQAHATAGRGLQAQILARRYPSSEAAVQIRVQALLTDGKVADAIQTLETHALRHSDERFLSQAAMLALSADQADEAERLAGLLAGSRDQHRRRIAHEILINTASRAKQWDRVIMQTSRLIDDTEIAEHDPDRDVHLVAYRWARAQAHYQLGRISDAYQVIREDPPLSPTTENQARLVLALLHILAPSVRDPGDSGQPARVVTQAEVLTRVTAVAQAFPDDEELVAAAVMTSLRLPVEEPADPAQLAKARALQEQFFERFPDSSLIQRFPINDILADITELLRTRLAAGAEQALQVGRAAWAGQIPLSVYTTSVRRSYAEALIKDALGCYVIAHPDPQITVAETAVAVDARNGTVVVDTSTLFLADSAFGDLAELRSQFDRLLLSASQRDDILAAQAALQMSSPFSMGWDPYTNRPTIEPADDATNQRWAMKADRLVAAIEWCEVVPDLPDNSEPGGRMWSAPIRLAKDRGVPLLADDAALRATGRNEGVPAFSSLNVLHALVTTGEQEPSAIDAAYQRLMGIRAADLPLLNKIYDIAATDHWSPRSYAAFLLARPVTWQPLQRGLGTYMALIHAIPDPDARDIALWCGTALYGLCQAVAPTAVPTAASSLAAWTVLTVHQSDLLPNLLETCPPIINQFAGETDLLRDIVMRIVDTLRQVVSAKHLGAAVLPLLEGLDKERRTRAVQIFLTTP